MLRQEQQLKSYKKPRNFEELPLYKDTEETIDLKKAMEIALGLHILIAGTVVVAPFILNLFGIDWTQLARPQIKQREDIEFVLVNQPEEDPINKNTPLRADRNTRAGGIHDPNKMISPPQPALPQSAPSQQNNQKKQKVVEQPAPKKAVQQPQKQVQKPQPQKVVQQPAKVQERPVAPKQVAAAPPRPTTRPVMPASKSPNTMKLPVPASKGAPRISTAQAGPVSSRPTGKYSGSGASGTPKPVVASGGYGRGTGTRMPSAGSGRGSAYSPGGGNIGNPGPGNPNGRPGVDAIKEPNFGPYMAELQRRIKANWDPPRGDESKRVVLLFKIAKDGRLLSVKVVKPSGSPAADKAALAAVELTAPFRQLPADFRGSNVDIQFTFDYNVFGVNKF